MIAGYAIPAVNVSTPISNHEVCYHNRSPTAFDWLLRIQLKLETDAYQVTSSSTVVASKTIDTRSDTERF
jgi:hypothetical protein